MRSYCLSVHVIWTIRSCNCCTISRCHCAKYFEISKKIFVFTSLLCFSELTDVSRYTSHQGRTSILLQKVQKNANIFLLYKLKCFLRTPPFCWRSKRGTLLWKRTNYIICFYFSERSQQRPRWKNNTRVRTWRWTKFLQEFLILDLKGIWVIQRTSIWLSLLNEKRSPKKL